jgi:hypothetical protein
VVAVSLVYILYSDLSNKLMSYESKPQILYIPKETQTDKASYTSAPRHNRNLSIAIPIEEDESLFNNSDTEYEFNKPPKTDLNAPAADSFDPQYMSTRKHRRNRSYPPTIVHRHKRIKTFKIPVYNAKSKVFASSTPKKKSKAKEKKFLLSTPTRQIALKDNHSKSSLKSPDKSMGSSDLSSPISPEYVPKGNLEPVMTDIVVESIVDVGLVSITEIPEEIRPITNYLADPTDETDKQLSKELNAFFKTFGSLPIPFRRVKSGIYLFGKTKLHMSIANGNLIVRVGGGYMRLAEFLKTNLPLETARMKESNVYKAYLAKINRVQKSVSEGSKFIVSPAKK